MATVAKDAKTFYCYNCEIQFKSKEAICESCQGEFVEEIQVEEEERQNQQPPPPILSSPSSRNNEATPPRTRQRDQLGEMLGQYLVQLVAAREQLEDSENYTLPVIPPPPQFLELMFRSQSSRRDPSSSSRPSRPGALEAIIGRLLEQLGDSGGPPPAEEVKIQNLPTSVITQKQVDQEIECSICKENFVLEDEYKTLPCNHMFHSHCIVAWLKLRDTCPTCRFSVNKGKAPEHMYS